MRRYLTELVIVKLILNRSLLSAAHSFQVSATTTTSDDNELCTEQTSNRILPSFLPQTPRDSVSWNLSNKHSSVDLG